MIRHARTRRARRGATIVESALVLALLLLFLFGIFEYCRYLLVTQLLSNAARDGVRYAATNIDKSANFVTTAESGLQSITSYVIQESKGANNWVSGFTVTVFPCDNAQIMQTPTPVIAPSSTIVNWKTYTSGGVEKQVSFTERLGLRITATDRPVLPVVWIPSGSGGNGLVVSFYGSGNTVPISITAVTNPEN